MAKTLLTNNTDLTRDKSFTFLNEDVVATGTTIRVQSIVGFQSLSTSSGQVVCIGEIGNERTEILRTSNSVALGPTYKEVTLRDALNFDHSQDTKVTLVDWNRVETQWAASVSGSKSTIAAYPVQIQVDQPETLVSDSSQTTGFYFQRFNETVGNTNSDWSDAIPFGGFDDNTVAMIKKRAVDEMGETIDGKIITHEFLNQCLWAARREYHNSLGKRPFRRNFNKVIGFALTGSYRIELPTDAETPYTAENIYGVRIGSNPNMFYYGKKQWDFDYRNRPHSTLELPYTRGTSTSIWLANGRDFTASGVITVEGTTISYTKATGSNNSLTITTHGGWSASGGSDAWQNVSYGLPDHFTVFADPGGSAYIYFNTPIDTAYVNMNIFADYYRTLLGYDSDGDVLDEPQYDMFVDFLKFKIKERKSKGNIPVIRTKTGQVLIADADYQAWTQKKGEALSGEHLETEINIYPDVSSFDIPSS